MISASSSITVYAIITQTRRTRILRMSTQSPANDKPTGPNLVISLPSPELREITTPCEVDNANTAPGERVTSSNSVTLGTQGISSIDFATEQPSLGVNAQPTTEEGQRQPSGSAPQVDPQADGTTSDVKTQELAALHAAWVSTRRPGRYRHLLTGATFHHPAGKAPRSSGPTAQDIPEGWKARLLEPTEERATSTVRRGSHMTSLHLFRSKH